MITHVFTDTKGLRGFVGLEEKVSSRYATGSSSPLWQGGRYLFKKAAQQVCCSLFPSPCGNEGGPPPWGKEAGVRILVAQERLTDSTGYLRSVPYGKAVTRIRNRQQRQLRRLRCEILIYSVFVLSQPLPSASYCMIYCCSADRFPDRRSPTLWQERGYRKGGGGSVHPFIYTCSDFPSEFKCHEELVRTVVNNCVHAVPSHKHYQVHYNTTIT